MIQGGNANNFSENDIKCKNLLLTKIMKTTKQ